MNIFDVFRVSGSGMAAERARVGVASSNLANAQTTRGTDGLPYRRLDVVLRAHQFQEAINDAAPQEVQVEEIVQDEKPGQKVYMPMHPDADAQGFVTMPNVNPMQEVVNLMTAQRGYDANATAVEAGKSLAQRALDILRG